MSCLRKGAEGMNLSDDSNSSFEMIPLGDRIGIGDAKERSKEHKNGRFKPARSISDSDSEPQSELPDFKDVLCNSPVLPSVQNVCRSAHSISDSAESDDEIESTLPDLKDVPFKSQSLPTLKKPKRAAVHIEVTLSDTDEECKQSLTNIPKKQRKATKKVIRIVQEDEKEEKMKMREEKKRQKELAKALKAAEREKQKNKKPEECLKSMQLIADQNIISMAGAEDIFAALDSRDIRYRLEENDVKFSVIWLRTVSDVTVENCQVVKKEREEIDALMVVIIPNKDFLNMVHSSVMEEKGKQSNRTTLLEYISNLRASFPQMEVTCVVVGFDKYIRDLKDGDDSELKSAAKRVTKTASEEVILEVQFQAFVNFKFVESMADFGNLLFHFTKSVAVAPERREKHKQRSAAFSFYIDAVVKHSVKISRDGSGLTELWRQQIKQFQNVSAEMAEAITSKYPSPQLLLQAYGHCDTVAEKEALLQDIVVRRNYGPLSTQRRIGRALSHKIFVFFSSREGDEVLRQ